LSAQRWAFAAATSLAPLVPLIGIIRAEASNPKRLTLKHHSDAKRCECILEKSNN
jgi:hypothetical protein